MPAAVSPEPAARQLAPCDVLALAQPTAAPALAAGASSLVRACSGLNDYSFSVLVLNPNDGDLGVYLGVGAAQCGSSCVAPRPAAPPL